MKAGHVGPAYVDLAVAFSKREGHVYGGVDCQVLLGGCGGLWRQRSTSLQSVSSFRSLERFCSDRKRTRTNRGCRHFIMSHSIAVQTPNHVPGGRLGQPFAHHADPPPASKRCRNNVPRMKAQNWEVIAARSRMKKRSQPSARDVDAGSGGSILGRLASPGKWTGPVPLKVQMLQGNPP